MAPRAPPTTAPPRCPRDSAAPAAAPAPAPTRAPVPALVAHPAKPSAPASKLVFSHIEVFISLPLVEIISGKARYDYMGIDTTRPPKLGRNEPRRQVYKAYKSLYLGSLRIDRCSGCLAAVWKNRAVGTLTGIAPFGRIALARFFKPRLNDHKQLKQMSPWFFSSECSSTLLLKTPTTHTAEAWR